MRVYLEAVDEVVSGEQLVEDELQSVLAACIVQGKHVEGPRVHMLITHTHTHTQTHTHTHTHTLLFIT